MISFDEEETINRLSTDGSHDVKIKDQGSIEKDNQDGRFNYSNSPPPFTMSRPLPKTESHSEFRTKRTSTTPGKESFQSSSEIAAATAATATATATTSTTAENYTEKSPPKFTSRHLAQNLVANTNTITYLLLLLALSVGINDASTYIDYRLFVSNQTGNTVFIGIGTLVPPINENLNVRYVALSLSTFIISGFLCGQLGTWFGRRRRSFVLLSNIIQTGLTFVAAGLRFWYATAEVASDNTNPRNYSVIVVLTFASAMQISLARGLGVNEIPTGMITSAWIDLVIDPAVLKVWRKNRGRDRRLAFVLTILVGGFIGAAAHTYCTPALPLLLAGIIKSVVVVGIVFLEGEEESAEEKEDRRTQEKSQIVGMSNVM